MVEYLPVAMERDFTRLRIAPQTHRAHARRFSLRLYVKFCYAYQTAENEIVEDSLYARSRIDAYRALASVGIKPYKMTGGDPLPWRMKAAVILLAIISIQLLAALLISAAG